jgi:adenine deaminase
LLFLAASCDKPGVCGKENVHVEISGNHGHEEGIPKKDLERGAGNYRLTGGSHDHRVRLSEETVGKLRAGEAVELRSSSENAHVHALRLRCGPGP